MSGYHAADGPRYAPPMAAFFDLVAKGRYDVRAGTSGTATVPAEAQVVSWSCSCAAGGAAGSVVITPGGAGQVASALPTITVPAGRGVGDDLVMGRLGPGTTIAFAGTEAYLVTLVLPPGAA